MKSDDITDRLLSAAAGHKPATPELPAGFSAGLFSRLMRETARQQSEQAAWLAWLRGAAWTATALCVAVLVWWLPLVREFSDARSAGLRTDETMELLLNLP
jgi:hypothetical protein